MKQKLFSILALLLMAATGAYATEFTSLKVGDVLHVGDVINTSTNYKVCDGSLDANFQPATLVRGNIVIGTMDVTESETGAYYLLKTQIGVYAGIIFGESIEGGYWPVTDTSDGISVTAIAPADYGYTELTFAVHEAPATYSVTLAEGTEDGDQWTIEPKTGLKGGETVIATYSGDRKVKSVKAVKKAATITDLATITADYEAKDGETLTGTLASNVKISIADGATVTLKDVTITNLGNNCDWAGINCPGDATLVLEGTNTVCAGRDGDGNNNYPGIYIAPDKTLTIQGDGTLTAYSDASEPFGAGIGGGYEIACGNIVINSGTITATGGAFAAGIGSGNRSGSCGNITINGGTITATGGNFAAGIGSGNNSGSCGTITISGGTVEATGGNSGAGIGGGNKNGACGTITITSGVTSVKATKGANAPNSIGKGEGGQDITVNIENGANVIMGPVTDLATITADYEAKDGETLTGTLASNVKISIAAGATVTLKDVTINGVDNFSYAWAGLNCAGDATITLEGTNTLKGFYADYPGIQVPMDKTLTIQGTGSLNARSNGYAAGIGGGYKIACGNITISGGTVEATGGALAAGIGGGGNASCGNITINGGTVTATGGNYGAGIGGGRNNGACGTITITSGVTSVTVTKGTNAPYSIGAGDGGQDITVNIENGANVTQK